VKHRMKLVRPLRSGQITIPAEFRQELAITQDTVLQIVLVGRELRIRPVKVTQTEAGSAWARDLYEMFALVRKEADHYSESDVNADIDKAVAAVRRKRGSRRS
jgi:bifunctional DNA-binding transcriptional regulator/antitoxin component of YhaV-PrlF toxin-antitoxin module